MDLIDRIEWLALGCVIGFVLGYIVRGIRDIKEELHEMETDVKRLRGEDGIVRKPLLADLVLLFVVAMTVWAAFGSANASDKSNEAADKASAAADQVLALQAEQKQNLDCTTQIAFDTIKALNERTTYTAAQTDANIALVQAQLNFLNQLNGDPPPSQEQALELYNNYVANVAAFLDLAEKTKTQQILNPYPTVEDLSACLAQDPEDTEEPTE